MRPYKIEKWEYWDGGRKPGKGYACHSKFYGSRTRKAGK